MKVIVEPQTGNVYELLDDLTNAEITAGLGHARWLRAETQPLHIKKDDMNDTPTPTPYTPDENLVTQWMDSAPEMDFDEWLAAEIDIQEDILEDEDDDGKTAGQAYIVEIKDEINRRLQNATYGVINGLWVELASRRVLTFDECEALGLDGTGRTL